MGFEMVVTGPSVDDSTRGTARRRHARKYGKVRRLRNPTTPPQSRFVEFPDDHDPTMAVPAHRPYALAIPVAHRTNRTCCLLGMITSLTNLR